MYNTPPQDMNLLGGPGPSGHYLAMELARVAASMKEQLKSDSIDNGSLDLSSWGDMGQFVDAAA